MRMPRQRAPDLVNVHSLRRHLELLLEPPGGNR